MKRFISITVLLMIAVMVIGCFATMSSEERKETYDMRKNVGSSQFVGATSPGGRDMMHSF